MEQTYRALTAPGISALVRAARWLVLVWQSPFYSALLTGLIVFGLSLGIRVPWRLSIFGYYNYLADAFLHGQLHLWSLPAGTVDLSLYQGQYYLYWGPLPAILILPLVALFGVGLSDVLQSIVFGSINTGLFALLLLQSNQKGLTRLDSSQRSLLVVFFALGTAQLPMTALGGVWHISQLVAITFALLAYLAAFSFENQKAFFWTGCAMACVLATRMSMVFVAIFLAWYLIRRHWNVGMIRLIRYSLAGTAPVVVTGLFLLLYNAARFGDPFETGLGYHLMSDAFLENYATYGFFSTHYIPTNVYLNFFFYPFIRLQPLSMLPLSGSLFLLSPLFLASIFVLWQERKEMGTWMLFLSVVIGSIPSLMIMAPGTISFGPRYLLDVAPPLLLLTACGIRRWSVTVVALFTGLSVVQYILGTVLMLKSWF